MHIVMVTVFPQDRNCIDGGVAGAARYLADELVKHPDVRLTVIAPSGRHGETICEQWDGFSVYRIGKKGTASFLPGTLYDIAAGKRYLRSLLREVNPDIVHFQGTTFLAADCEKPNVLTIHGIAEKDAMWDSRRRSLRWPRWLLLKLTEEYGRCRVPNIILISEYVKQFLPDKKQTQQTWLIDNPVADSYFDLERKFELGRIFCCSRVRPLKNILGLIKAFTLIVQKLPDSQLRIAGVQETAYLKTCERQVAANGLQGKVHFLGNISITKVQFELSKANCLVAPSFQENAPLTIAEAMAAGIPVVGSNIGGISGMVEDGRTGLLVDPYDTKNICEAVSNILADEALAKSMGQRAKQVAKKRFKASVVCEKTLQVYREILKQTL